MKDLKHLGLESETPTPIGVQVFSLIGMVTFFAALLFSHLFTWN